MQKMKKDFYDLADKLVCKVAGLEVLLMNFSGEESDFVRFNNSAVRQGGTVFQQDLTLELIDGARHAS
ncbi:MAG TPA: TldE/PmbA family protein, partial [Phycisphaerae bacterium]|nr:TldE/PmbA family protein [Phycisphaerae bacterium]